MRRADFGWAVDYSVVIARRNASSAPIPASRNPDDLREIPWFTVYLRTNHPSHKLNCPAARCPALLIAGSFLVVLVLSRASPLRSSLIGSDSTITGQNCLTEII